MKQVKTLAQNDKTSIIIVLVNEILVNSVWFKKHSRS